MHTASKGQGLEESTGAGRWRCFPPAASLCDDGCVSSGLVALLRREGLAALEASALPRFSLPLEENGEASLPRVAALLGDDPRTDFLEEMAACFEEARLSEAFELGVAVVVLPGPSALPLAPVPKARGSLLAAFRPPVPETLAPRLMPLLEALDEDVVGAGGTLYLMSAVEPSAALLERQVGAETLARWQREKERADPAGILGGELLAPR